MDLNVAITGRRSVREYTAQAVDEKLIRALIDAAVQAPSAVNQQPWTFTVVRDQGVLDRISREAKSHMLTTMPANTQSDHLRPHLVDPDFHIFYHAPVLILISASAQGPWIVEDSALAAENLMLAAHAAGLGSCWRNSATCRARPHPKCSISGAPVGKPGDRTGMMFSASTARLPSIEGCVVA